MIPAGCLFVIGQSKGGWGVSTVQKARLNGHLVEAGPDSPEQALCPACGEEVCKRRRKVSRNEYTYFYRHRTGVGDGCPLRYRPTG